MAVVARVFRGSRFLMSPAASRGAKGLPGLMQPFPISEEMRRFAGGAPELARTQAMKLIWAHINANGLQNPAKQTEINCDATLKSLFGGRDKVGFLDIAKLLNAHFLKRTNKTRFH